MQDSKFSLPEQTLEKYVLNNDFVINGKHYPWLTAYDIMQKENRMECEICLWHAPHTPCGPQLEVWKKCKEKKRIFEEEQEDDPVCNEIFEKQYFPCLMNAMGSDAGRDYYTTRYEMFLNRSTKDVIKAWFKLQKIKLFTKMLSRD